MRRAQLEMIGLVFIVIILVLGIVLYVRFSATAPERDTSAQVQGATSFLVALAETGLCGTSFQRVAAACAEGRTFCASGDPCREAQELAEDIAAVALDERGVRYNLSVAGTPIAVYGGCNSGNPEVDLIAAPSVQVVLSGGGATRAMTLALCE